MNKIWLGIGVLLIWDFILSIREIRSVFDLIFICIIGVTAIISLLLLLFCVIGCEI